MLNFLSPAYNYFTRLLKTNEGKNLIRGRVSPLPMSEAAILADVQKVLSYVATDGYKAWEQEAWAHANTCMKLILKAEANEREVLIARGELRAILDLLGVAEKAHQRQKDYEQKQIKAKQSPALKA